MSHLLKPGEHYIIEDNTAAIAVLTENGLLDKLQPRYGFKVAFCIFRTEHHHCLGSYFSRMDKDSDNGYIVVALPKTSWSQDDSSTYFTEIITDVSEGKIKIDDEVVVKPERN